MSSADPDESGVPEVSGVPALIDDYRAQRDAWRARGQDLERMREEALAAADREARNIVATAQNDVRQILLKAHHDLLALSAHVSAAAEDDKLARGGAAGAGAAATPDDPRDVRDVFVTAQQDVHGLLGEARTELEGLAAEVMTLRADAKPSPAFAVAAAAGLAEPEPLGGAAELFQSELDLPNVRNDRVRYIVVAGIMGAVILGAGGWLRWQQSAAGDRQAPQQVVSPVATSTPQPAPNETEPPPAGPVDEVATDGLSINVEATQSVWIQVSADGQVVATRVFEPGETYFVTGASDVSVRAGDAGAVMVTVNGSTPSPLGGAGAVLTRRFTSTR